MKKAAIVLNAILDIKNEGNQMNLVSIKKKTNLGTSTIYRELGHLALAGFVMEMPTEPGNYELNGNLAQIETGFTRMFPEVAMLETIRSKLQAVCTKRKVGRPKKNILGF